MPRLSLLTLCCATLLSLAAGCADPSNAPAPAGGASAPAAASAEKEAAAIQEALAQLPEEDRKIAEAQKTCPIGKDLLGSMGVPVKVDVDGKPVFICCEGCRTALLAKAEKEKAAAAAPAEESKPAQN